MSRRERRSTSFPNREAIPVDSRGWRRFAATPGQNARTRMNPSGVSDHKRRSSPPFMNHPTPPKPALRANRQVAQGAARLCGRALGTRTPIRATGHAPINAIPNRVAIPERSRGWRRFAATPGHDAKTRMNPDGVPVHNRRFAPPFMNPPTPPKPALRANRQGAQGAARLCGRALGTRALICGKSRRTSPIFERQRVHHKR